MERENAIQYMKNHMTNNKAMGLLAQAEFVKWSYSNPSVHAKYFDGCWIMSPQGFTASRRFCFFIHRRIESADSIASCIDIIVRNRGFHSLFGSITRTGLGVTYCIPVIGNDTSLERIGWHMFRYENEKLNEIDPYSFFGTWAGQRGRESRGGTWADHINKRYESLEMDFLEPIVLNQIFYNSFIKGVFHKPVSDPYDTDAFIVSYEGENISS